MQSNGKPRRPEPVLIVGHPSGYAECFGENVIPKFVFCPAAFSTEAERTAEDVLELSLSPFWRQLYFPGKLKASAMLRPQLPSKMREALAVRELLKTLSTLEGVL